MTDIAVRIAEVIHRSFAGAHGATQGGQLPAWARDAAAAVVKELHLQSTGRGNYAWGYGTGIGGFIPETDPEESWRRARPTAEVRIHCDYPGCGTTATCWKCL
jgi:hypothetical protein